MIDSNFDDGDMLIGDVFTVNGYNLHVVHCDMLVREVFIINGYNQPLNLMMVTCQCHYLSNQIFMRRGDRHVNIEECCII